jgi:hypothetical protein
MEPVITINGIQLTKAQSMSVRVALSGFKMELKQAGLGADEHGLAMTEAYLRRLDEILRLIASVKEPSEDYGHNFVTTGRSSTCIRCGYTETSADGQQLRPACRTEPPEVEQ